MTSEFNAEKDDVDLLVTESQCAQLLQTAFEESAAGRVHLSIRRQSAEKTELTLWDIRASQRLKVDLWSVFSQLPDQPRMMVTAEHLQSFLSAHTCPLTAAGRLAPDVEFCLLVLHLAAKKKSLSSQSVRQRIHEVSDRLAASIPELIAESPPDSFLSLINISEELRGAAGRHHNQSYFAGGVGPGVLIRRAAAVAETFLLERMSRQGLQSHDVLKPRTNRSVSSSWRRWVMKIVPCLAITGSDGAGKSTLCSEFARQQTLPVRPLVAKKLYRRSWLYRIAGSLAKSLTRTSRERLDDLLAPLITLRAAFALWFSCVLSGSGLRRQISQLLSKNPVASAANQKSDSSPHRTDMLLLDRSPASFLITSRKSKSPRLARCAAWIERLIPPVTTVLLVIPFRDLVSRKREFSSASGHETYQQQLFAQGLRQRPCELHVLANTGSADQSARVLAQMRNCSRGSSNPDHSLQIQSSEFEKSGPNSARAAA